MDIKLENDNIPANFQGIDRIPLPEGENFVKADRPCQKHKISFPFNSKRMYPEMTNILVYHCEDCGWFVNDGAPYWKKGEK